MKLSEEEIFNFIKCAEELNELSAVLIQQVTKPKKNLRKKILGELSDVLFRMWPVMELFDEGEIKSQINKKSKKDDNE
jgi:hypothetical protein